MFVLAVTVFSHIVIEGVYVCYQLCLVHTLRDITHIRSLDTWDKLHNKGTIADKLSSCIHKKINKIKDVQLCVKRGDALGHTRRITLSHPQA